MAQPDSPYKRLNVPLCVNYVNNDKALTILAESCSLIYVSISICQLVWYDIVKQVGFEPTKWGAPHDTNQWATLAFNFDVWLFPYILRYTFVYCYMAVLRSTNRISFLSWPVNAYAIRYFHIKLYPLSITLSYFRLNTGAGSICYCPYWWSILDLNQWLHTFYRYNYHSRGRLKPLAQCFI